VIDLNNLFDVVGLIPARGGSKGILRKNLQVLYGETSLLGDTIIHARLSSISALYVSSDDDEILEEANFYGCTPIKRPSIIAADTSSTDDVIKHFLGQLPHSAKPRIVVLLQCTYPFHTSFSINSVIEFLASSNGEYDSVFAASRSHAFLWRQDADLIAKGVNHNSEAPRSRRQDLTHTEVVELGSVYAFTAEAFTYTSSRFASKPAPVILSDPIHLEIDEPKDLFVSRHLSLRIKDYIYSNKGVSTLKALVVDCDGVLTDNKIDVSSNGVESARFNKYDSMAISYLKSIGIKILVLTSETSSYVLNRALKLKIEVISQSKCKALDLSSWLISNSLLYSEVLYIGNDLNDLTVFPLVGSFCCPSDASAQVIAHSNYVSSAKGGQGVVREIASVYFGMI